MNRPAVAVLGVDEESPSNTNRSVGLFYLGLLWQQVKRPASLLLLIGYDYAPSERNHATYMDRGVRTIQRRENDGCRFGASEQENVLGLTQNSRLLAMLNSLASRIGPERQNCAGSLNFVHLFAKLL